MRSVIPFDTHAYVKKLAAAGMPEAQAEVMAEAWNGLVIEHLATKDDLVAVRDDLRALEERLSKDLARVREEMRGDIDLVRADVARIKEEIRSESRSDLKDLELRLTLRLGGMMAVGFAAMTAFIKLL